MTFLFDIDAMTPGQTVTLAVCSTNDGGWNHRPVTVSRVPAGFVYVLDGIAAHAVDIDDSSPCNPGHRGLYAMMQNQGVRLFAYALPRQVVARAYQILRRRRVAASPSRANLFGRRDSAVQCLADARDMAAKPNAPAYGGGSIWAGLGGSDGRAFKIGGRHGTVCRWIENTESKGLRATGTAERLAGLRHTGWHTDPEGDGDLIAGFVWQLPARKGQTRFVAGYQDSNNDGAACISLELYDDAESAASAADSIAETVAESEREYREADYAGRDARRLAADVLEKGKAWVEVARTIKTAFAERHDARRDDVPLSATRAWLAAAIQNARALCDDYRDARDTARQAIEDSRPGHWQGDTIRAAWLEGYENGI